MTRSATAERILRARVAEAGLRVITVAETRANHRGRHRAFAALVEVDAADIDAQERADRAARRESGRIDAVLCAVIAGLSVVSSLAVIVLQAAVGLAPLPACVIGIGSVLAAWFALPAAAAAWDRLTARRLRRTACAMQRLELALAADDASPPCGWDRRVLAEIDAMDGRGGAGAPAMVGPEVIRAVAAREPRRSPLVCRAQPGRFDPLLTNRKREP